MTPPSSNISDGLEGVVAADGLDLLEVVESVDEVKAPPLAHGERSEDDVGDGAFRAEEAFAGGGNRFEAVKLGGDLPGEFVAAAHRRGKRWRDGLRRRPALWKTAQSGDDELAQTLARRGSSAGGAALLHPRLNNGDAAAIGGEQMLDDLLDAPLFRVQTRLGLGLVRVETTKAGGYFGFQFAQIIVHNS